MSVDDSALVAAMARRDPAGLDGAYRRYADRLYAYARSLVGDSHAAADVVHDTFLLASQHVTQLRDPTRLPQWLYAIARHEGLRQLKRQARHAQLEVAEELAADTVDLVGGIRGAEIAEMVRAAVAGLSTGDREIAELAIRHQMAAAEIASVLDVPVNNAHARLSRAREQLLVSLGCLLVARHRGGCAELGELLKGWDGQLKPLLRKRIHRHIEACAECSAVRRERLNPAALFSAYAALPFLAPPRLRPVGDVAALEPPRWHSRTGFPRPRRRAAIGAGIGALIIVLIVGGTALATPEAETVPPPIVTLGPIVVTEEPSPSPAAPSLSPTPSPSSAKPSTGPPALAFTATGSAPCVATPIVKFTVNVTANANLDSGKVIVVGLIGTRNLTVTGKTATMTFTEAAPPEISWHVEIKAADGRTKVGPQQSTHNTCYP
jgi:RNA polymerase sigma factor (sigma-70 family)